MPSDRVQALFDHAQQLEELADGYGADPARYRAADQAWERAFRAAEREGGAQLLEQLAGEYGFSTPASREARHDLGLADTHSDVAQLDPYETNVEQAPTCDFCTAEGEAAWRYPCEDFTNVSHLVNSETGQRHTVTTELRGDWYACDPCRDMIEAHGWRHVLDRHVDITRDRELLGGSWTPEMEAAERVVVTKAFEGVRECRKPGPPEPVNPRTYHAPPVTPPPPRRPPEPPGYDGGRLAERCCAC
jgi:hypothetical protein